MENGNQVWMQALRKPKRQDGPGSGRGTGICQGVASTLVFSSFDCDGSRTSTAISELLIWKRCERGPGRWREGLERPSRWRGYWEGIVFRPRVEGEWTKKMGCRSAKRKVA